MAFYSPQTFLVLFTAAPEVCIRDVFTLYNPSAYTVHMKHLFNVGFSKHSENMTMKSLSTLR